MPTNTIDDLGWLIFSASASVSVAVVTAAPIAALVLVVAAAGADAANAVIGLTISDVAEDVRDLRASTLLLLVVPSLGARQPKVTDTGASDSAQSGIDELREFHCKFGFVLLLSYLFFHFLLVRLLFFLSAVQPLRQIPQHPHHYSSAKADTRRKQQAAFESGPCSTFSSASFRSDPLWSSSVDSYLPSLHPTKV